MRLLPNTARRELFLFGVGSLPPLKEVVNLRTLTALILAFLLFCPLAQSGAQEGKSPPVQQAPARAEAPAPGRTPEASFLDRAALAVPELGLPLRAIGVVFLLWLAAALVVLWAIQAFRRPRTQTGPAEGPAGLKLALSEPRPLGLGADGVRFAPETERQQSESVLLRMGQERWNLPGFMALYSPLRSLETGSLSFVPEGGLHILRDYHYERDADAQSGFADLHALVLELFRSCAREEPEEQALFLRDASGALSCYGRMRGDVLLRDGFRPLPEGPVVDDLRSGGAVFSADGASLFLPLLCAEGFIGYYLFLAGRPLFRRELVEELWYEVRRFSERALQGKLFEAAVRDPESTLGSGALFQHDLSLTFRLAGPNARQLVLMHFTGSVPVFWRSVGAVLSAAFPAHSVYRIGLSHVALLGPHSSEDSFSETIAHALATLRSEASIGVTVGAAVLGPDVGSTQEWFSRAREAQEDAARAGPNHFRFWAYERRVEAGRRGA